MVGCFPVKLFFKIFVPVCCSFVTHVILQDVPSSCTFYMMYLHSLQGLLLLILAFQINLLAQLLFWCSAGILGCCSVLLTHTFFLDQLSDWFYLKKSFWLLFWICSGPSLRLFLLVLWYFRSLCGTSCPLPHSLFGILHCLCMGICMFFAC